MTALILTAALCAGAVSLFRWAVPAATAASTNAVESPYFATNVKAAVSTPVQDWERGSLPHLYMADVQWSQEPYGHATVGLAGSAPTSLAMACVKMTGDTALDPAHFATFATENNLTASDELTLETFIENATTSCGLEAVSLNVDELSLRRALARGNAVIVVTKPGTFSLLPSCLAIERVNAKSELDIVDPASALRSGKSWTFSDILNASATVYAVRSSAS